MNKDVTMNSAKHNQEKGSKPNQDSRVAAGGELHQNAAGEHPALTTNQGIPISDNQNSLRANSHGPTLLEDFVLREKITHFDHERIPERIVHARATGAHGFFELTESLKAYTTAKLLTDAGATVKIIAPKVGGVKLASGSMVPADGQLAGTPSVLFDAVAVILSDEGARTLSMESAAIDFVRDAFGHLKAIAVDKGGQVLLRKANIAQDAGVVDANDKNAFITAAKTRQ